MAIEERVRPTTATKPYALLRAGFPYLTTLGMRRVTTYPMDIAIGEEGRLYVLCRDDGAGASIRRTNWDDEDLDTISGNGTDEGKLLWPVQLIRDGGENLYVSDEATHRISAFGRDGTFLGCWGQHGSEPGQLNRPSGIAFDADENLYVVDTMNHRVQKFTKDGWFILAFGRHGSGEGELDMPWGIAVDSDGDVYVGDWKNDRVQKFTAEGDFVMAFGHSGSGDGELNRPAGVAVDAHGDVYVADRGNHRVVLFDKTGRYVEQFIGDATLSKSGRRYILANPKVLRGREMTTLEHTKRLRGPASVRLDDEGRMYIPDYGSHRIQVYQKEAYPLSEADIWAPPKAPFLYNV
ncbi:MAG: NHL repeat-containing protein [Chloroflexota bacterium]|nr:NHL repeat-containing protein [Chloroflexota bacterium]